MLALDLFEQLDNPTPSVETLAKKYNVSVRAVNQQLLKGVQVELEHTSDPEVAEEIALDHLSEKLDYYTQLSKVGLEESTLSLMDGFRELLPIAVKHLNLPHLPKIHLKKEQSGTHQASFGGYDPETDEIHLTISNRHPVDVLRTLAHELVHYKQKLDGKLVDDSWKTGSPAENEANSEAGIILRMFSKQSPEFMNVKPIMAENINEAKCPPATQDIAINTSNRNSTIKNYMYGPLNFEYPDDYWAKAAKLWNTSKESAKQSLCGNCVAFDISPRMEKCMPGKVSDEYGKLGYCWMHHFKCHSARTCETWAAGGPITDDAISLDWGKRASMNENFVEGSDKKEAILRIQKMLNNKYNANLDLDGILGPLTRKSINKFMPNAKIGLADEPNKTTAVQGKKMKENFADGKKPGRKGLSKRVGIPKGASIAQLEKIAKSSSGEKRRMAQWQLNMKSGKNK